MKDRPHNERALIACVALFAIACEDAPEEVDAGACPAIAACGGDIVGSWSVQSLCFDSLDPVIMDLAGTASCAGTVKDIHVSIAGTFNFDGDGGVLIDVTQKIDVEATFSAECLTPDPDEQVCEESELFLRDEVTEATCELADGGCDCTISGEERPYISSERYEVRGAMLRQAGSESSYCVEGDELRIRRTAAGVMGTFVLKRD